MSFWAGVAIGYVVIIGVGLTLGRYLATRFPHRGDGGPAVEHGPEPVGPAHAAELDDCPPLGSAFDRALMPGAFAAEPASASR